MLAVAVSGTAMATEVKPTSSPTGMAVIKSETGFKLFYKGNKTEDVTVKIYDQQGVQVFSETLRNLDSFMRPYNLNTLTEGEYTVELSNSEGKSLEKISYTRQPVGRPMNLVRVKNSDKYLLRIPNKGSDVLIVRVYDAFENLLYENSEPVNGDFAKLYNLSRIGNFHFEVTDSSGVTQSLSSTN